MDEGGAARDWLVAYKRRIIAGIVTILSVTIVATLFLIFCTLRSQLVDEGERRTEELGTVVHSSLSYLMETRDPDRMQQTLVAIVKDNPPVVRAFIIDNRGRIAYSSSETDVGTVLDRFTEQSCRGCHSGPVAVPSGRTISLTVSGERVQRYVHIIPNEPSCHRCHSAETRINGKLIIDRSLASTDALIGTIILIIAGLGLVSLAVLVPFLRRFLSRGVNTYINEIRLKSAELQMLYTVVERLSTTIELEALKRVIIDIVSEAVDADRIDMILPSEYKESGAIVWTKAGDSMERKKVDPASSLRSVIDWWVDDRLTEYEVAAGGREIHMPISKGGQRLALIIARSERASFDLSQLPLVRAMANHIAVAFENAILYHIAITDELTGLYSNRHFRQMVLKRYGAYHEFGEKSALLMVDIDDFKKVNDTCGHPGGDVVLKDVARCVMTAIREDDLAFRYGGEEFAVILPESDETAGAAVAERMRAMVEGHVFRADHHELSVTVSIGVSSWPASAESIKELIMEADKGLYEAKHSGKNRVVVRTRGGRRGTDRGPQRSGEE